MAGLVPAIHVLLAAKEGVDGRDEHGHDDCWLRMHFQSVSFRESVDEAFAVLIGSAW